MENRNSKEEVFSRPPSATVDLFSTFGTTDGIRVYVVNVFNVFIGK